MEKEKIERINFLARKAKTEALSDEEKLEQQSLRDEYRAEVRGGYMEQMDRVYMVDSNGKKTKLIKE